MPPRKPLGVVVGRVERGDLEADHRRRLGQLAEQVAQPLARQAAGRRELRGHHRRVEHVEVEVDVDVLAVELVAELAAGCRIVGVEITALEDESAVEVVAEAVEPLLR